MIRSFRCKKTERLFSGGKAPREFRAFQPQAERKLIMIEAAVQLTDLRWPPGNHLESLGGNRKGQHSIRINGQWRLCFRWTAQGAEDVEIVDYH